MSTRKRRMTICDVKVEHTLTAMQKTADAKSEFIKRFTNYPNQIRQILEIDMEEIEKNGYAAAVANLVKKGMNVNYTEEDLKNVEEEVNALERELTTLTNEKNRLQQNLEYREQLLKEFTPKFAELDARAAKNQELKLMIGLQECMLKVEEYYERKENGST